MEVLLETSNSSWEVKDFTFPSSRVQCTYITMALPHSEAYISLFCSLVCFDKLQKWKSDEKWGRHRSIHHMSDGGGAYRGEL